MGKTPEKIQHTIYFVLAVTSQAEIYCRITQRAKCFFCDAFFFSHFKNLGRKKGILMNIFVKPGVFFVFFCKPKDKETILWTMKN